jgi:hypothetical protein
MRCVVVGCNRYASGPPIVFSKTHVLLCSVHRAAFVTDPTAWDGELDPTGQRVERIWRREGIGSAS